MAQGICEKIAKDNNLDITAKSAGVATISGMSISDNSVAVCKEIGIDISQIKTTSIADLNVDDFDRIFVMTSNHKAQLVYFGVNENKISVLAENFGGVSDPYGGDLQTYRKCRDEIYKAIEISIKEL
jgi:protein-tyrosine phosphatase